MTSAAIWIGVLLLAGWALGAFAAVLQIRNHPAERIAVFGSGGGGSEFSWRAFGPFLLAIILCTFGGSRLQDNFIGYWALPVAFVPLFLLYLIPVTVHNRRQL